MVVRPTARQWQNCCNTFDITFHTLQDATNSSVAEGNDTRPRRYFNQNSIQVPGVGRVVYEDNTVSVMIGNTLVHEFPGMAVLQVYNDIEGSLTLYGSSNGRSFPGYGTLTNYQSIKNTKCVDSIIY